MQIESLYINIHLCPQAIESLALQWQHWIGNFLEMKWRYILLMQCILSKFNIYSLKSERSLNRFCQLKANTQKLFCFFLGFGECVKTLTLEERSNATLNCTSPNVFISWTFNGMPAPFSQTLEPCEDGSGNDWMSTNDSETCTQYSSYLHLLNFQLCHQGIYKCVGNSSNATVTTYEEYNITMSQIFSG